MLKQLCGLWLLCRVGGHEAKHQQPHKHDGDVMNRLFLARLSYFLNI